MRLEERDHTLVELSLRVAAEKFEENVKLVETALVDQPNNFGLKSLKEQYEWQAKRAAELADALNAGELKVKVPRWVSGE